MSRLKLVVALGDRMQFSALIGGRLLSR